MPLVLLALLITSEWCAALDWWPHRHHLSIAWTKPFPRGTNSPLNIGGLDSSGHEYVFIHYSDDVKSGRPLLGHVEVWDSRFHLHEQLNLPHPIARVEPCQADRDDTGEIMVCYRSPDGVGIRVYDWPETDVLFDFEICETDVRWRNSSHWDIEFRFVNYVQGERDLFLIQPQVGFAKGPRGVIAINPQTGDSLWYARCASGVQSWSLINSSQGETIITLGTGASCNGAIYNETADTVSYLHAYNTDGELLWRHVKESPFSWFYLAAAKAKQPCDEIVAISSTLSVNDFIPTLLRVDARNGEVLQQRQLFPMNQRPWMIPWDDCASGERRFVVTAEPETTVVINSSLQALSLKLPRGQVNEVCADFDGDGRDDLALKQPDGYLSIWSFDGELLFREKVSGTFAAQQRIQNGEYSRLWMHNGETFTAYDVTLNNWYHAELALAGSGYILGTAALAWLIVWSVRTRRAYLRARREKLVLEGWAQTASFQAHDTKKPIAVVQRALENFEVRMARDFPDADIKQFASRVRGEIARMLQTSRQIQIISRTIQPDFQTHDLNALIALTVDRMNLLEQTQVVHENPGRQLRAVFDYRLIESLLENLIGNAMEASPANETVRVSADSGANDGQEVKIVVTDRGEGMSEERIAEILDGKGSLKQGGQGLGIRSAKWIAEIHGGGLTVNSSSGAGTTITVLLNPTPAKQAN